MAHALAKCSCDVNVSLCVIILLSQLLLGMLGRETLFLLLFLFERKLVCLFYLFILKKKTNNFSEFVLLWAYLVCLTLNVAICTHMRYHVLGSIMKVTLIISLYILPHITIGFYINFLKEISYSK